MLKPCKSCDKKFYPKSNRQIYCRACGRRGKGKCETCGKEFARTSNTTGRYCSRRCWYHAYDAKNVRKCTVCAKPFEGPERQKACSRGCGDKLRRTAKRNTRCERCQAPLSPTCHPRIRFCSQSCALRGRTGASGPRKEGATQKHSAGYILVKHDGDWMFQHRFVMEQKLGRRLEPFEKVHHKNGKRDDNRRSNLELWVAKGKSRKDPAGQRLLDLMRDFLKQPEIINPKAARAAFKRTFRI